MKNKTILWISIIAAVVFVVATAMAYVRPPLAVDAELPFWLHNNLPSWLDGPMHALDTVGDVGIVMGAFGTVVIVTLVIRRWWAAAFVAVSALAAVLTNIGLKTLVQRPRPDIFPIEVDSMYSFPSGHTMLTTTFVLVVIVLLWKVGLRWSIAIAGGILTLAMGVSRLYLGEHYTSDVIGSYCLSVLIVIAAAYLFLHYKAQLRNNRQRSAGGNSSN